MAKAKKEEVKHKNSLESFIKREKHKLRPNGLNLRLPNEEIKINAKQPKPRRRSKAQKQFGIIYKMKKYGSLTLF